MTVPVLATKLFAPTGRSRLVARGRLADRLDRTLAPGRRLTLVSAPAGSGKTTALGAWLAGLDPEHVHVGWVPLDEGDDDLVRLLAHVVAALDGAGLAVGEGVLRTAAAGGTADALTALVNGVAAAVAAAPGHRWVLVLDDYHRVGSPAVHEAVTFLVERLPERVHVVVSTREDPPLPLARLRGRDELTELRGADLRFSEDEAGEFLLDVMGLGLDAPEVRALQERTEGWVAGLQLAALSLRGVPDTDVAAFITSFAGSHRFVVDFLVEEVLARRPRPVREFLLRTSVLERLTGDLCDAVTRGTDGARLLERLERDNLFVVPLDEQRSWYRYHHLFADVLRARLLAEAPELVPVLQRRASDWHASRGSTLDAVRHAFAADDADRAAYLVEQAVPQLRRTRQDALLIGWLEELPDRVVRRSPVLGILSGWSMLVAGDLPGCASRLDDAERALTAGATDEALRASWADTDDLRTAPATIAVHRASLAQARGDLAGTVRHARRALDLAGPEDHLLRGAGGGFLGLAAWAAGDVHEGLRLFGDAVGSLHLAGNVVDELDGTVVLADMWVAAGAPGRARDLLEEALRRATADGEPYPRAVADLHVALADLDRELDRLDSARSHLGTARTFGEHASITENRHRWSLVTAQVAAASGDPEAAAEHLRDAEARYRRGFYPDVRPVAAVRARLQVARGDLSAATTWARAAGVRLDDAVDHVREFAHLTLVRLLLAQHRAGRRLDPAPVERPLAAVLDLLERLEVAAAGDGRHGSRREVLVLRALTHEATGDRPQAVAALRRALVDGAEPDAYVRLFLDEGEPMLALLRALVTGGPGEPGGPGGPGGSDDAVRVRAGALLARASGPVATPRRESPLADPLSPREQEVLRLLDSDLTGPDIARTLYVSLNTLRSHTKRIFTKLDVRTRAAAVRRAHALGLLP